MVDRPLAALNANSAYRVPPITSAWRTLVRSARFLKGQPVLAISLIPILVLMVAAIVAPGCPSQIPIAATS